MDVLLFTCGKGGAGCSTIASSVATVAAGRGLRTLLIELSAYNSSQSLFANIPTAANAKDIQAEAPLSPAEPLRANLDLIWGTRFANGRAEELAALITAERRRGNYRLIILDIAAGEPVSDRQIASLSTLTMLVALPDLTSLAANFGLFKNLTTGPIGRLGILINRVSDESEANDLSTRFSSLCEQYVGRIPETFAALPADSLVNAAQLLQKSVMTGTARSSFARRIERLTEKLIDRSHDSVTSTPTSRGLRARFDQPLTINMKRKLADIKD